jgi:hypothetical protein
MRASVDAAGPDRRMIFNDQGDAARDLEARHPGWVILWRHWARCFWAFPCWITTAPEPVEAKQIGDLLALMEKVELQHRL